MFRPAYSWASSTARPQAFGLATTGGIVTHTGVAGLTLGGGIGWLHRKHGLTIDQLLSVDLITAEGDLVKASQTEKPDLFWGLRGGGNFGIVTEFEFRLHPIGPIVLAGPIFWPMDQAPALLRFYREWSADASDELMTMVIQRKALPLASIPRELHGKHVIATQAARRCRQQARCGVCAGITLTSVASRRSRCADHRGHERLDLRFPAPANLTRDVRFGLAEIEHRRPERLERPHDPRAC